MKKRILLTAIGIGLLLTGSAVAGTFTEGIVVNGGENRLARLTLVRAGAAHVEGVLKLQVTVDDARQLKGYGFVLHYDPDRYEFVEATQANDSPLSAGGAHPALFIASDRNPGQVAIGTMKVDGGAGSGDGTLVEFTFRSTDQPLPGDFRVTDGVLVDLDGGIDTVTDVVIRDLRNLPTDYALSQNAPNPFNPSTSISYQLPVAGRVKLAVYNVLGQEIQTLLDADVEAGRYDVMWDGRDNGGRSLASGIYLYRIQAGNFSDIRRMMLLK